MDASASYVMQMMCWREEILFRVTLTGLRTEPCVNMWFNEDKCKFLHLDQDNPKHEKSLGSELTESISAKQNSMVHEKLDTSQECAFAVLKARYTGLLARYTDIYWTPWKEM